VLTAFDVILPAAFRGLDVAATRFFPTDPTVPPNPIRVAPVFALNYGDSADVDVPPGLNVALVHYPVEPTLAASPIFFGLADVLPPVVDG
jgi:hypothetical protein